VRKYEGKIVGILGTVIIHLIAGIIFMTFKLQSLKTDKQEIQKFEIEFADIEEMKGAQQQPSEPPPTTVENVLYDDVEMLNIARNLSSKSEEKIDPDDYIDRVKEELIQSGRLGTNNYIDRGKANAETIESDYLGVEDQEIDTKKEQKQDDSREMAANYQGPTRISYDLQGRNHIYLPLPIYKCQGSGKIVLTIDVNQKGFVENAKISEGDCTSNDECLYEAATKAALLSRFEPNLNAPRIQKGSLTYIFVAQ
jgi:hypothetical protein